MPVAEVGRPPVLIVVVEGCTRMVVGSQDSESVMVPVGVTLVPVKVGVDSVVVGANVVGDGVDNGGSSVLDTAVVALPIGGRLMLAVGVVTGGKVSEAVVEFPGMLVIGGSALDEGTVAGSEMDGVETTSDDVGIRPDEVGTIVGIVTESVGGTTVDDWVPFTIGVGVGTIVGRSDVRLMPLEVETGSLVGSVADALVGVKIVGRSVGNVIPKLSLLVALTLPAVVETVFGPSVVVGTSAEVVGVKIVGRSVGSVMSRRPLEVLVPLTESATEVEAVALAVVEASVVVVVPRVGSRVSPRPSEEVEVSVSVALVVPVVVLDLVVSSPLRMLEMISPRSGDSVEVGEAEDDRVGVIVTLVEVLVVLLLSLPVAVGLPMMGSRMSEGRTMRGLLGSSSLAVVEEPPLVVDVVDAFGNVN